MGRNLGYRLFQNFDNKYCIIKDYLKKIKMSLRFIKKQKLQFVNWFKKFSRPYDLPSMNEFCEAHTLMLNNRHEPKFMKTIDKDTLAIAENILKKNEFLREQILGDDKILCRRGEIGSIQVDIHPLKQNPERLREYLEWKEKGKPRILAIGGPSATTQSLISSVIPQIREKYDRSYYCRSYKESNAFHSGNHSHSRDAAALNAIPILNGHHLLKHILKRRFCRLSLEEVVRADFTKIDVKLNRPSYYLEYIKNEVNGMLQILKRKSGINNQHLVNRIQGVVAQEINTVLEKATGVSFCDFSGDRAREVPTLSIQFVMSEKLNEVTKFDHSTFSHIDQLKVREYSRQKIFQHFPEAQHVVTAYEECDDFTYNIEVFDQEKQLCEEANTMWKQNKTASKIYVDLNQNGVPYACGVEFTDGQFVPANKMHLSLGYKAKYRIRNSNIDPLMTKIFPATGVSTVYLFKQTPYLKKIIEERGRKINVSVKNSHWTIIDYDDQYALVRATAGGNTGTEEYMPSYFLNLTANTRNIFGEAFIGVVSSYGCARSINYKNSTQFADLADGLVISYGKGGGGMTKKPTEAYKALEYLGLGNQLKKYFNGQGERFKITEKMDEIQENNKQTFLYYKSRQRIVNTLFK